MGRKQKSSILDDIFVVLKVAPTWLGPALAIVLFALIRWLMPVFLVGEPGKMSVASILRPLCITVSWLIAGLVLLVWVMAEIYKIANKKLFDEQVDLESIRALSWQEFERLICESYRRQGYTAEVVGSASGDGGVDVKLRRGSETVLVQCKHWKVYSVGVSLVRELLGVVVSQRASKGILVTSGRYTQDSVGFGRDNPQIELIDGPALFKMIEGVRKDRTENGAAAINNGARLTPEPPTNPTPACPACGTMMVMRTAHKGANPGSQFWGCPQYPACRGTRVF